MPKNGIPVAIAYDFDGTLSPANMQEYDFIPKLEIAPKTFWSEADVLARQHQMDPILAYMWLMLREANKKEIPVKKTDFMEFGKTIQLFKGVQEWFSRINAYAKQKGIALEHFVISSGIREMIEATVIYPEFKRVYASAFMFDHNGIAKWPALAINYTTKTQYLFRINKGSLDVYDNSVINKYVPMDQRSVPFENMIFIGDGETDIPCMRLVKELGGHSIAVYQPEKEKARVQAERLVAEGRASLMTLADYRDGQGLDLIVKAILDKIEATARIR